MLIPRSNDAESNSPRSVLRLFCCLNISQNTSSSEDNIKRAFLCWGGIQQEWFLLSLGSGAPVWTACLYLSNSHTGNPRDYCNVNYKCFLLFVSSQQLSKTDVICIRSWLQNWADNALDGVPQVFSKLKVSVLTVCHWFSNNAHWSMSKGPLSSHHKEVVRPQKFVTKVFFYFVTQTADDVQISMLIPRLNDAESNSPRSVLRLSCYLYTPK